MLLGYNTNGFPHHELADVCDLLAGLRYGAIAITPDVFHLNPDHGGLEAARRLRPRIDDLGLAVAVETGARFLLDARTKHQPTLLSAPAGAELRKDSLLACLEIAEALGAQTFSFWSGSWAASADEPDGPPERAALLDRLCTGATHVLDAAVGSGVSVCFEPEPGMAVASLAELDQFLELLGRNDLSVMLDVGHVPVTETISPAAALRRMGPALGGLQLDDSRGGVHEHIFPGDGEIDFVELFAAVREADFTGLACLELPRHSHDPVTTARRGKAWFDALFSGA
jgi:sugar phosphate isomerase/epimerase